MYSTRHYPDKQKKIGQYHRQIQSDIKQRKEKSTERPNDKSRETIES